MEHKCSKCGRGFHLAALPTIAQRLIISPRSYFAFNEYIYAVCPSCWQKDWADERRYLGALGPRAFYGLALAFLIAFVAMVVYLGFF